MSDSFHEEKYPIFNSCHVEYFWENIKVYSHFVSFHNTEMGQLAEIFPGGRQAPVCSNQSLVWLLMLCSTLDNSVTADDLVPISTRSSAVTILSLNKLPNSWKSVHNPHFTEQPAPNEFHTQRKVIAHQSRIKKIISCKHEIDKLNISEVIIDDCIMSLLIFRGWIVLSHVLWLSHVVKKISTT